MGREGEGGRIPQTPPHPLGEGGAPGQTRPVLGVPPPPGVLQPPQHPQTAGRGEGRGGPPPPKKRGVGK